MATADPNMMVDEEEGGGGGETSRTGDEQALPSSEGAAPLEEEGNQNSKDEDGDEDANDDEEEDGNRLLLPDSSTVFYDHFTLPYPSNAVRFRNKVTDHTSRSIHKRAATRVYENQNTQFVLEETLEDEYVMNGGGGGVGTTTENDDPNNTNSHPSSMMMTMTEKKSTKRKIRVKLLDNSTKNLQFLRAVYGVVTALWTGLLLVFLLQVLLTTTLEVAVQYGETELNSEFSFFGFIGVLIALIQFCFGFAHAMVIAVAFIIDVWSGHVLIQKIFSTRRISEVFVDWLFFTFIILCPTLVFCFCIFAGSEIWWDIGALFWISSIAFFYVLFSIGVLYFEIKAALDLVVEEGEDITNWNTLFEALKKCALLRLIHVYSGVMKTKYIGYSVQSVFQSNEGGDGMEPELEDYVEASKRTSPACCTRPTMWGCWKRTENHAGWFPFPIYKHLEEFGERLYTIHDFQEYRPFVTKNTWSLERLYCRPRNSRYVAVIKGPGRVTKDQMKSSIVCGFMAMGLYMMILIAILVYFETNAVLIVVVVVIFLLIISTDIRDNLRLAKIVTTVKREKAKTPSSDDDPRNDGGATTTLHPQEPEGDDSDRQVNEAVHLVTEYRRVTQPTDGFCWAMMVLRLLILYLYPMVTLFTTDNKFVAVLFLVVATITNIRYYVNVVTVIEETGKMKLNRGKTPEQRWEAMSRLSRVIQTISYDRSRVVWLIFFGLFGLLVVGILVGALGTVNQPESVTDSFNFIPQDEYYYPPQPMDVRYQTCSLSRDLFGDNATLADFAFMANIAYHEPEDIESELTIWFGGDVVSESDTVEQWKSNSIYAESPVSFQLFRFVQTGTGIISVRGTKTAWDLVSSKADSVVPLLIVVYHLSAHP